MPERATSSLWARPALTLIPGGRYEDIDLVMIRENTEGLYVGFEHYIPIDGDPRTVDWFRDQYSRGFPTDRRVRLRLRG